jgi:hypothetical protein
MADVYVLRVTTDITVLDAPAVMLWVVEAKSPDLAMKAVEDEVPTNWAVELTDYELTSETIARLNLSPGKPQTLA